jgi:3-hydroxyacyl-CoA dehydrogenase
MPALHLSHRERERERERKRVCVCVREEREKGDKGRKSVQGVYKESYEETEKTWKRKE